MKKEIRYTLDKATNVVPRVQNPELVKDVVFQVGLNNIHFAIEEPEKIKPEDIPTMNNDKTLDMQIRYRNEFPNARQHIVASPPMDTQHIESNKALQKLIKFTGSNFITAKPFLDKNTKQLRANTMKVKHGKIDYHYNEVGIKILAKGIKKSLFSTANVHNIQLTQISHSMKESDLARKQSTPNNLNEPICIE